MRCREYVRACVRACVEGGEGGVGERDDEGVVVHVAKAVRAVRGKEEGGRERGMTVCARSKQVQR